MSTKDFEQSALDVTSRLRNFWLLVSILFNCIHDSGDFTQSFLPGYISLSSQVSYIPSWVIYLFHQSLLVIVLSVDKESSLVSNLHCRGPPSPPPPLPMDSKTPSLPSYFPSSLLSVWPLPLAFILFARDEEADSIFSRRNKLQVGKYSRMLQIEQFYQYRQANRALLQTAGRLWMHLILK